MTVQEEILEKLGKDAVLAGLRRRIDSGKGTFADSFAYCDRAGKMLGEILAQRLPDISPDDREALCVHLLREQYTDINALCDSVQKALDNALGLHLAPQRAPFNKERAHAIGSALRDPTVPEKTQQRRARSAPATAVRAMHDDRIMAEVRFRSRAGLKCYIHRTSNGKCCSWCSDVAGRYVYGDEPKDVYRRHDNCSCSVTYENGRQRLDAWSRQTWEKPKAGAGAPEPVRLTREQAMELSARHEVIILPMANRLTNGGNGGTINSDSGRNEIAITDEVIRNLSNPGFFEDDHTNQAILEQAGALLAEAQRHAPGTEIGKHIPLSLNPEYVKTFQGGEGEHTVNLGRCEIPSITIHNHPSGETFSKRDIEKFVVDENAKAMCVIGNNGKWYVLIKNDDFDWMQFQMKVFEFSDAPDFAERILKEAERYGFTYYES